MSSLTMTLGLSALVLTVTSACSSGPQSSAPRIFRGRVVEQGSDIAQHTVALVQNTNAGLRAFCSGTLIAPRTVLTASHCLEDGGPTFQVAFGLGFLPNDQVSVVPGRGFQNPDFKAEDSGYTASDVAVVKLDQASPSFTAPVEVATVDDLSVGQTVILAGYGTLGYNSRNALIQNTAAKLYETSVQVEAFLSERQQMIVYRSSDTSSACAGDSGGPLYVRSAQGSLKVAGVTRGPVVEDQDSLRCVGRGTYTNATVFKDWINGSH